MPNHLKMPTHVPSARCSVWSGQRQSSSAWASVLVAGQASRGDAANGWANGTVFCTLVALDPLANGVNPATTHQFPAFPGKLSPHLHLPDHRGDCPCVGTGSRGRRGGAPGAATGFALMVLAGERLEGTACARTLESECRRKTPRGKTAHKAEKDSVGDAKPAAPV